LNVLNHLFNDNYFEKECGSRGFTKGSGKSHKISASTESHSVGNNNYGGTGTGNGGSAVSITVLTLSTFGTWTWNTDALFSFITYLNRTLETLLEEMEETLSSLNNKPFEEVQLKHFFTSLLK